MFLLAFIAQIHMLLIIFIKFVQNNFIKILNRSGVEVRQMNVVCP